MARKVSKDLQLGSVPVKCNVFDLVSSFSKERKDEIEMPLIAFSTPSADRGFHIEGSVTKSNRLFSIFATMLVVQ